MNLIYDDKRRIVGFINNDGYEAKFEYDESGYVVKSTDSDDNEIVINKNKICINGETYMFDTEEELQFTDVVNFLKKVTSILN